MTDSSPLRSRLFSYGLPLLCLVLGGLGGWWWQARSISADPAGGMSAGDKAAIEKVVGDYLVEHPEILPKAFDALQKKQNASALASIRGDLERPFDGTILGNPAGKITLVEFTDFACTYCRKSVADVEELIAANPDLKVVIRELPILSPESADAAKMGFAAAQQGKYAAYHRAMFAAGRPDKLSIEAAARSAGVDLARAQRSLADPRLESELAANIDMARALGFSGTPSWVVGDTILSGAVGKDKLAKAIAEIRG